MKLESFFIGITLSVLVLSLGIILISESVSNYGITDFDNSSFGKVTQKTIDLDKSQKALTDKIAGQKTTENNAWDNMIQGGYLALNTVIGTFGIVGEYFTALGQEMMIPPSIIGWGVAITIILLLLTVIYIIMRVGNSAG